MELHACRTGVVKRRSDSDRHPPNGRRTRSGIRSLCVLSPARRAVGRPSGRRIGRDDRMPHLRITALAGGVGGARFLRGLLHHLRAAGADADVTVVGNTADDITLHGLRVCPDLDTVMYTLGGGIHESQGWGRADETFTVKEELAAYGVGPEWFGLGDRDFATHIVRTQMIGAGYPLSAVTEALCDRWKPGVRLIHMTDDRVETHVAVEVDGEHKAVHFQEYWVRLRASVPAQAVVPVGAEQAKPAPGVLEAIAGSDVVLFPP